MRVPRAGLPGFTDFQHDERPADCDGDSAPHPDFAVSGLCSSWARRRRHGLRGSHLSMCRNIKTLFNFEPPATELEIRDAALQFVRKLSGFNLPSRANEAAFEQAVDEVAASARALIGSLVTSAGPRQREIEAAKARARSAQRFGHRP
jgi:hypothetical protein